MCILVQPEDVRAYSLHPRDRLDHRSTIRLLHSRMSDHEYSRPAALDDWAGATTCRHTRTLGSEHGVHCCSSARDAIASDMSSFTRRPAAGDGSSAEVLLIPERDIISSSGQEWRRSESARALADAAGHSWRAATRDAGAQTAAAEAHHDRMP